MGVISTPLRWPAAWKDPGMLSLLQATPVRHLLLDSAVPGLADAAGKAGLVAEFCHELLPKAAGVFRPARHYS